jgi:hypothetical protein
MPGMKNHPQDHVDGCRAAQALEPFEAMFFNNVVLVLDLRPSPVAQISEAFFAEIQGKYV